MSNRRQFLRETAMAGAFVLGGGLAGKVMAGQQPAPKRRQVSVGGQRVKTVDFHCHTMIPEAMALLGRKVPNPHQLLDDPERLRQMDEQGIDVQAISINAVWYGADRSVATEIIQMQNEKLAAFCQDHSDRFVAMATNALQFPDLAADQVEHGIKKLGLRAVSVAGSVAGEELSSRRFDPFWAKVEQLGAPVFIHPDGTAELEKRLKGNGALGNAIGNPLETTIALAKLIFDGTLDRFPNLKIVAAHGGGYLGSYPDRLDKVCPTRPQQCTAIGKEPTEYMKHMYYDSLVFTGEALRHLVANWGADHMVMGTDYPFGWTTTSVDHILNTPGLNDADKIAILGGNACKLLNIPA